MALEVFRVTKNCRVGKVKRFPPQDCAKMEIFGFKDGLGSFPVRIRTKYCVFQRLFPPQLGEGRGGERLINSV